jgi:hypothetical protein
MEEGAAAMEMGWGGAFIEPAKINKLTEEDGCNKHWEHR